MTSHKKYKVTQLTPEARIVSLHQCEVIDSITSAFAGDSLEEDTEVALLCLLNVTRELD